MEQRSREDLFLLILEIFSEMSQARTAHLVIWQPRAGGYVRFRPAAGRQTIAVGIPQAFPVLLAEDRETPPSLPASLADDYFRSLGVRGLADLPDRDSLEYYFLFWDQGRLLGYIAVHGRRDRLGIRRPVASGNARQRGLDGAPEAGRTMNRPLRPGRCFT
jgi:hypothetical protein